MSVNFFVSRKSWCYFSEFSSHHNLQALEGTNFYYLHIKKLVIRRPKIGKRGWELFYCSKLFYLIWITESVKKDPQQEWLLLIWCILIKLCMNIIRMLTISIIIFILTKSFGIFNLCYLNYLNSLKWRNC